ncbi:MAG: hypothetical protein ACXAEU_12455 [Candidatus Hodarchaeales archaeon]|jgi:hypothetical protein
MVSFRIWSAIFAAPWLQSIKRFLTSKGINSSDDFVEKRYLMVDKKRKKGTYHQHFLYSKYSISLLRIYYKFYQEGVKIVPRDVKMTPTLLLHLYIGDGSLEPNRLMLLTECFTREDNEYIIDLLREELGILFKLKYTKKANNKVYPRIQITNLKDITRFFQYLEKAPREKVKLAKSVFPWKFDRNMTKYCALYDKNYEKVL